MNSNAIGRFIVVAVATAVFPSALCAAGANSVADRVFAFLDRNHDSRIDAEEFVKIPTTMRDWLVGKGLQPGKSLSKDDFRRVYGDMMGDLRKAATTGTTAPARTTAAAPPRSRNGSRLYAAGEAPTATVDNRQSPTDRLPADYRNLDLDKDGQVDFFEWRKNQKDVAEFRNLDRNRDSVLSVVELGGDPIGASPADKGDAESDDGAKPDSGPSVAGEDVAGKTYDQLSDGRKKEYRAVIKTYFDYLDKEGNGDGKLQEKEWDGSRRIKPIFVNAGIDIKKDMTEADFIQHYTKLVGTKDKTWRKQFKGKRRDGGDRRFRKDRKDKDRKRRRF
ncbi:MAG: hypothetical protein ACE5KM_10260 [Planctomycetaceae bacterium]